MSEASEHIAGAIRNQALADVADRITALGHDFHPAAVPIVAANVAIASMLGQLLDVDLDQRANVMADIMDLAAPAYLTDPPPQCRHCGCQLQEGELRVCSSCLGL